MVEAIRRQLPPGNDPEDLVFTGPGGGPGRSGGAGVPWGARTVLSRHNLHRSYQGAAAKLADPAVPLAPPPDESCGPCATTVHSASTSSPRG